MNNLFRMIRIGIFISALLLVFPAENFGQVFDSGPSDSALFTEVINWPPNPNFPFFSIGGAPNETVQLNVADGGDVGNFFNAFSGSEVNISGGTVGSSFVARSGSEVNISGGAMERLFEANSGSVVNISSGILGCCFTAFSGSEVNISGGTFGPVFCAEPNSIVKISGGTVGPVFGAESGSDVEIRGGDFNLNGAAFTGTTITLAADDVFTGTLADGSTFVFSDLAVDDLSGVELFTEVALPAIDKAPKFVNTDISSDPSGLRGGQELTLQAGGVLGENFAVVDATLNIDDGNVGDNLETARSVVNISGGTVGLGFNAFEGSVVYISGGSVGGDFAPIASFRANPGSVVNISGGNVGDVFLARTGSVVNISGGTVGNGFEAFSGSEVNLFGTEFLLDGTLLDLTDGEPMVIADRDVVLSGILADGSALSFDLNTSGNSGDNFDPNATITVTLESPVVLGDVNLDDTVGFDDIPAFIELLISGDFQAEADIDLDGAVTFADIPLFIDVLLVQ